MSAAESTPAGQREAINPRLVALWDLGGGIFILLGGSFLHFAYELSGFSVLAALVGSVNESTWEHLKLFYWPGVVFAIVQHAYLRHRVNNFWLSKGVALWITAIGIALAFYCYLGIVLPIAGKGDLAGTIVTAVIGIGLGQVASYALLTGRQRASWTRTAGIVLIVTLGTAMVVFTFAPPHVFLFDNFFGYEYQGEYGILDDYTPYLIFR